MRTICGDRPSHSGFWLLIKKGQYNAIVSKHAG